MLGMVDGVLATFATLRCVLGLLLACTSGSVMVEDMTPRVELERGEKRGWTPKCGRANANRFDCAENGQLNPFCAVAIPDQGERKLLG